MRADAHDLLVGIPRERPQLDPRTGAGRVWNETLRRLGDLVTVETLPRRRRRLGRGKRPDVWLATANEGPVEESEPVVVVNHGAGWLTEDRFWEMVPVTTLRS